MLSQSPPDFLSFVIALLLVMCAIAGVVYVIFEVVRWFSGMVSLFSILGWRTPQRDR